MKTFDPETLEALTLYLSDFDLEELEAVYEYLRSYKLGFNEHLGDPAVWRNAYEPAMEAAKLGQYDRAQRENEANNAKALEGPRLTDEEREAGDRELRKILGIGLDGNTATDGQVFGSTPKRQGQQQGGNGFQGVL